MPLRIEQIRREATDIISLDLVRPDDGVLPAWEPGAHLVLVLPSGTARQYSLCGARADRHVYRVAVQLEHEGRGGSLEVHRDLRVGQQVQVREPRNNFAVPDAPGYLFLAGGIGITPLLPMIERAVTSGRGARLVYGARSADRMAFGRELSRLLPAPARCFLPEDEHGRVNCAEAVADLPDGWLVCGCGPGGMLAALTAACAERGISDRLYLESFAGDAMPLAVGDHKADQPVEVELRRSGRTVIVPAGTTVLEGIREFCSVLSSCTEGYCGTCEVNVLDGVPDHRDSVLTDDERATNRTMMVCVSRANSSRLVLDI
ncbi:2Fe-2S iron-sulfur cluster binding domain-containing protein [Amycolatopsis sp. RM579]|uniref:2Fe-2S iron-sulfur cluster binding domain-containing protein n=1 Tax=Amycolatopsis pithecellobii TaxID=664692 RepID=A0A6N7YR38_9PSEU|nr:2Fe-2S iron-sulfur cluster binding domain-containing protein [Amycolatopsis pithecellobii]